MGACNGITIGAEYDCTNPLKAKVAERILIGNLADIASVTYDVTNTSVITAITLKTGSKAMYAFTGVRSTNKPDISLVADDVSVGFKHMIGFSVFDVSSAQKVNLQGMASKDMFVIYQNPKDSSLGDSVWEVMGVNTGMQMSTLNRLPASKDGSYKIELATPEEASETSLPNSFWDTSIAITEPKIEALLTPTAP